MQASFVSNNTQFILQKKDVEMLIRLVNGAIEYDPPEDSAMLQQLEALAVKLNKL